MNTSDHAPASPPSTLSELIASAEYNLRWFDLGRRVVPVSRDTAEKFEAGSAPWPHPYLRHAWCGLLLWPRQEQDGEPAVWFLRMPLDEQGKLLLPIRDRFLRQLTAALAPLPQQAGATNGNGSDPGKHLQQALEASELTYTPPEERRAVFHAKAAKMLARPASNHYSAAKAYVKNPSALAWQQLALQGIADLAVRWQASQSDLTSQMARLAAPVFNTLCHCLESEAIDHKITEAIVTRASAELEGQQPDRALLTAAVRGISRSQATGMRKDLLLKVLESPLGEDGEILAAIGSRCNEDLLTPEIAHLWLEKLSSSQPQETFNLLLTDLLFLPELRAILLDLLRNPERPESVARAFGNFLSPGNQ